jgi:hypothetical protein
MHVWGGQEKHTQAGTEYAFRIRHNHTGVVNELWANHVVNAWRRQHNRGVDERGQEGREEGKEKREHTIFETHRQTHYESKPNLALPL